MSIYLNQNQSECPFTTKDSWVILSKTEQSIKRKIEAIGTPLKDWDIQINYGIKTGCNEAFIISTEKRNEILNSCVSDDERKRTEEIIRPILRGRDIKRNGYDWNELWLINTHNGIKGKLSKIEISEFPAIKNHLDQFKDKIWSRADQGDTPYNLRNCAYMDLLERPKIVYSEIVNSPQFYLDEGKFFPEATAFVLTGKETELKYLVKILNSDYCFYLFKTFYAGGGLGAKGVRYKKAFIEKLPIQKFTNSSEQISLISENNKEKQEFLVKKIYSLQEY